MKRIYVAGRYSGSNVLDVLRNIGRGNAASAKLFELGFAPFSPWSDRDHVLHNPDGVFTVEQFKEASIKWLEVSDAVLAISISAGVNAELKLAALLGIPIFYKIEDLLRWNNEL